MVRNCKILLSLPVTNFTSKGFNQPAFQPSSTHNPTTLNQQGADVGTQYRSAIFYHDEHQKERAEYYIKRLNEEKIWPKPIVTEVTAFSAFYPAEDYHDNYYDNNPGQGYCNFVITPKIEKFEKVFGNKMKEKFR